MHQPQWEGRLVSIQVGQPATHGSTELEGAWTTGFFKHAIRGPVFVHPLNLAGDGQADLKHHGGIDKAVLAYSADHYPVWREELPHEVPLGAFGENLTIGGLREDQVCIGDVWQLGEVLLEVSQPRQPCWKLGRRWRNKLLPKLVVNSGKTGWYYRVRRTGMIELDSTIELENRPRPEWTISRANQVMYGSLPAEERRTLASLPELSTAWKEELS